jgi:hypothetical protein
MRIFLDDVRDIYDVYPYGYRDKWVIVRNYDDFVKEVIREFPTYIAFDHDLAPEHYNMDAMKSREEYTKLRQTFTEKTGLDCAKWLCEYCHKHGYKFPEFGIHSFNPVGSQDIQQYIATYIRLVEGGK